MCPHRFGCILPHGGPSSQCKFDSPIFFQPQHGRHSWLWISQSSWLDYVGIDWVGNLWTSSMSTALRCQYLTAVFDLWSQCVAHLWRGHQIFRRGCRQWTSRSQNLEVRPKYGPAPFLFAPHSNQLGWKAQPFGQWLEWCSAGQSRVQFQVLCDTIWCHHLDLFLHQCNCLLASGLMIGSPCQAQSVVSLWMELTTKGIYRHNHIIKGILSRF